MRETSKLLLLTLYKLKKKSKEAQMQNKKEYITNVHYGGNFLDAKIFWKDIATLIQKLLYVCSSETHTKYNNI